MPAAPLIVFNGYPAVGKASVASALKDIIPGSRFLPGGLLREPAFAIFGHQEEEGLDELLKAFRTTALNCIAHNPGLQRHTLITTFYQERSSVLDIEIKEYLACAKAGGRPFVVFNLYCSAEENYRRLLRRAERGTTRLTDLSVLREIRRRNVVYRFYDHGYARPDVYEFNLNVESISPRDVAPQVLEYVRRIPGVVL